MIDATVSVRPGEARTLWLDLRDRILSNDSLYLSIASGAPGFDARAIDGTSIRLVFKDRAAALPEHIADRRSEEHTSELQSLMRNSYAVFCLKKKKQKQK